MTSLSLTCGVAGLTASMHADGALSMVLYVLKSICAEANTRFRLPSDDGISAQALVYITTQLVDVGTSSQSSPHHG